MIQSILSRSEKIQNLKSLRSIDSYIKDLNEQIANQYPQPSGAIYLHGDIITVRLYNTAIHEYNSEAKLRNSYTNENWQYRNTVTFIKPLRKRVN